MTRHGTRTTYQDGCRCPDCRQANSRYQRLYRARWQPGSKPNAALAARTHDTLTRAELLAARNTAPPPP